MITPILDHIASPDLRECILDIVKDMLIDDLNNLSDDEIKDYISLINHFMSHFREFPYHNRHNLLITASDNELHIGYKLENNQDRINLCICIESLWHKYLFAKQ